MWARGNMDSRDGQLPALLATNLNANFERLVLAYQDRLYSFVLSRTHSTLVAEEIVLTAFERAYYALRTYPAQRIQILKLEPWLFEITRNVFYNSIRDTRTRQANLPSISLDLSEDSPLLEIQDESIEPDEEICRREDRQELEASVEMLPLPYQETIRLYYFDNLNAREVAERLHQPIGTVKSTIHRGTRLLRKALQEHLKERR
jgi:RNA polymerase sigma-70 factor (ECF subfamily)